MYLEDAGDYILEGVADLSELRHLLLVEIQNDFYDTFALGWVKIWFQYSVEVLLCNIGEYILMMTVWKEWLIAAYWR